MRTFEVLDIATKTELYDLWLRFKKLELAWSTCENEAVEYDLLTEMNVKEETLDLAIHYWLGEDYPENDLKAFFYEYWKSHGQTIEYKG